MMTTAGKSKGPYPYPFKLPESGRFPRPKEPTWPKPWKQIEREHQEDILWNEEMHITFRCEACKELVSPKVPACTGARTHVRCPKCNHNQEL